MAAVEAGANYHDEEALLLAAAGVVASLVTVTAAHSRRRRSRPRRAWMRCLFQRRQSRGTCEVLLRELRDEDPELFRAYLRMDVATYDQLLELLGPHIVGCQRYRRPISIREKLSVTLRYLATGTKYEKYTVNHIL